MKLKLILFSAFFSCLIFSSFVSIQLSRNVLVGTVQGHELLMPYTLDPNSGLKTNNDWKRQTLDSFRVIPNRTRLTDVILCQACREAKVPGAFSCESRIMSNFDRDSESNRTVVSEAMNQVSSQYAQHCGSCNSEMCNYRIQPLLGFDEAAPVVYAAKTYATLSSIPSKRRLPIDLEAFKRSFPKNATEGPLFIYNPSIIPIPRLTKASLEQAGGHTSTPTYLTSFRVSDVSACLATGFDWKIYGSNLVAIAVMDDRLEILKHAILNIKRSVPSRIKKGFEDFRLFLINGTAFLNHRNNLLPIQVTVDQPTDGGVSRIIPNVYTSAGLKVSIPSNFPPNVLEIQQMTHGKNYQILNLPNGDAIVELWPVPHITGRIIGLNENLPKLVERTKTWSQPFPALPVDSSLRLPGYGMSRDRGSACCVSLEQEYYVGKYNYSHVYVGISHSKAEQHVEDQGYIFMSRLYAFVPHHPFEVIAVSSHFCFGHSEADTPEPFASLTKNNLHLRGRIYACPTVHFVSGIVEKVGDPSRVIVSYGINDCISRFVELEKTDIAWRLGLSNDTIGP